MKVRVTVPARDDLDEIWDYIARNNPVAANKVVYRIRDRFEMLGRQPLLGEACKDLQPGLRNFPVRPYVIYYCVLDDVVSIVRAPARRTRCRTALLKPQFAGWPSLLQAGCVAQETPSRTLNKNERSTP